MRTDGRSILLSGGVNDGSAAQLDKALQIAPSITTVVLASDGGWIREGKMLAEVIRKRGLNTYVEGSCASACTIAFLAGKDRAAAPVARIGFHASRSIGAVAKAAPEETAELRTIYRGAGLPETFVDQVINTPNDKMWYPSHDVLLSAGVLTRRSLGGETAALSTVVRSKAGLAVDFKKVDLFALLAERSPKDFDAVIEAAWEKTQQGATDAEVTTAARAELTAALPKFLPLASDKTLVAYQSLMQEELEALRDRDPAACVEMAFPSGKPMSILGNLPQELIKRELLLMTNMLREYDSSRSIKPSQQVIEQVAQRAAASMTQEQLLVFSDEDIRRQSRPALSCDAAIAFFAGLNAIPLAERGHAIRVIYAAH